MLDSSLTRVRPHKHRFITLSPTCCVLTTLQWGTFIIQQQFLMIHLLKGLLISLVMTLNLTSPLHCRGFKSCRGPQAQATLPSLKNRARAHPLHSPTRSAIYHFCLGKMEGNNCDSHNNNFIRSGYVFIIEGLKHCG